MSIPKLDRTTLEHVLAQVGIRALEAADIFPDNDSQREGYLSALEDVSAEIAETIQELSK
jgi:hypothetical protein